MKIPTKFLVVALCALIDLKAQTVEVFVSAHPDDWQLFMNPNAYHSLETQGTKVIFLHTTAGDAGSGTGNNNYYLAREEGSLRAIRFIANAINPEAGLGGEMHPESVTINNHVIKKLTYSNVVIYFLRLPDGNYDGSGYAVHQYGSLKKIYNGSVATISAVDGSTTYTSLSDLKITIKSLITSESKAAEDIRFHLAETDTLTNKGDHSDHLNSSRLMQDVARDLNVASVNLYLEYITNGMDQNIVGNDYLISAGTWAATASGLSDFYHKSTWDSVHNVWIGKQYFRSMKISQNNRK